jgi:hypothetical protein
VREPATLHQIAGYLFTLGGEVGDERDGLADLLQQEPFAVGGEAEEGHRQDGPFADQSGGAELRAPLFLRFSSLRRALGVKACGNRKSH